MSVFKGFTHAPTFPMMFKSASSRRARRLMPTFAGLLRSVSTNLSDVLKLDSN